MMSWLAERRRYRTYTTYTSYTTYKEQNAVAAGRKATDGAATGNAGVLAGPLEKG
jgi:hypothetical protein